MIILAILVLAAVGFSLLALYWASEAGKEARRAAQIPRTPRPAPPVCACKHGANFHDEGGCHYVERGAVIEWDDCGDATAYGNLPCDCVRYVGPGSSYDPGLDQDIARAAQKIQDGQ